jgi:anti-sigma B factor antagonist
MLTISKKQQDHFMILNLDGRVDADGSLQLQTVLKGLFEANHYEIILDLSKTDYLNSAGLRAFADTLTKCRDHGGDLKLVAPNSKIMRLLEIIGFTMFFKIFNDLDTAFKA